MKMFLKKICSQFLKKTSEYTVLCALFTIAICMSGSILFRGAESLHQLFYDCIKIFNPDTAIYIFFYFGCFGYVFLLGTLGAKRWKWYFFWPLALILPLFIGIFMLQNHSGNPGCDSSAYHAAACYFAETVKNHKMTWDLFKIFLNTAPVNTRGVWGWGWIYLFFGKGQKICCIANLSYLILTGLFLAGAARLIFRSQNAGRWTALLFYLVPNEYFTLPIPFNETPGMFYFAVSIFLFALLFRSEQRIWRQQRGHLKLFYKKDVWTVSGGIVLGFSLSLAEKTRGIGLLLLLLIFFFYLSYLLNGMFHGRVKHWKKHVFRTLLLVMMPCLLYWVAEKTILRIPPEKDGSRLLIDYLIQENNHQAGDRRYIPNVRRIHKVKIGAAELFQLVMQKYFSEETSCQAIREITGRLLIYSHPYTAIMTPMWCTTPFSIFLCKKVYPHILILYRLMFFTLAVAGALTLTGKVSWRSPLVPVIWYTFASLVLSLTVLECNDRYHYCILTPAALFCAGYWLSNRDRKYERMMEGEHCHTRETGLVIFVFLFLVFGGISYVGNYLYHKTTYTMDLRKSALKFSPGQKDVLDYRREFWKDRNSRILWLWEPGKDDYVELSWQKNDLIPGQKYRFRAGIKVSRLAMIDKKVNYDLILKANGQEIFCWDARKPGVSICRVREFFGISDTDLYFVSQELNADAKGHIEFSLFMKNNIDTKKRGIFSKIFNVELRPAGK